MKKWIPWFVFALIVAVLLYARFGGETKEAGAAAGGSAQTPALPVDVVLVRMDTLQNDLSVTGQLIADEQVVLTTEVSGRVVEILFQEGAVVQKNQLLLRLNDEDLQAQLEKARRQLALAEITEKRLEGLLGKHAISQEEYDQASTQVQVWQSEERLLQAQLARLSIRAPFAGTIGLREISPGAYLSPGTAVATLASTGTLKLEFDLPESALPYIRPGAQLRFTTASSPGTFAATVYAQDPEIDPQTRALRVRARVPNPQGNLRPGAFASIQMPRTDAEASVVIPSQAVVPSSRGNVVYVVQADTVAIRPVQLGLRKDAYIQVLSGLKPGEHVMVSGILQARPGIRVQPKLVH